MTRIDQFESVFRAAQRKLYDHAWIKPRRLLVVTDVDGARIEAYIQRLRPFIASLVDHGAELSISAVGADDTDTIDKLLKTVEEHQPDLVVTYRCLHSSAWRWPYTIGDHIEVLTQVTDRPVLLLPRVDTGDASSEPLTAPATVLAMTDHLSGDGRLVNWAATFAGHGKLVLAHIEDEAIFEQYIDLCSKTPLIDTDVARRELKRLILSEPRGWVDTVRTTLEAVRARGEQVPTVTSEVKLGHLLPAYSGLVTDHGADLLVLNTKDDDQLAIHGLAYPLMVELRQVPMLLL